MIFNTITLAAVLGATAVSAHGDIDREIAMRSAMLEHTSRDLSHCATKLKARGFEERATQRRSETRAKLMKKRNIRGTWTMRIVTSAKVFSRKEKY
jgi:uncharacterized protein (DUF2384 family)